MIVKAEKLALCGPFDPFFGSYYEDFDLSYRLKKIGGKVGICNAAKLRHFNGSVSRSKKAKRRRERWIVRNRFIIRARWSATSRMACLLRFFLRDFPINLARSLAWRPGAQSVRSMLLAFVDVILLSLRIASAWFDTWCWRRYLLKIGWGERVGSSLNDRR